MAHCASSWCWLDAEGLGSIQSASISPQLIGLGNSFHSSDDRFASLDIVPEIGEAHRQRPSHFGCQGEASRYKHPSPQPSGQFAFDMFDQRLSFHSGDLKAGTVGNPSAMTPAETDEDVAVDRGRSKPTQTDLGPESCSSEPRQ